MLDNWKTNSNVSMLPVLARSMLDMRPMNEVLVASILVTLGAFALACLSSTYVYLIEQAVCRKHFMINDPTRVNGAGVVDEESCKIPDIQAHVAAINGIYMFMAFLPGKTGTWGFEMQVADNIAAFFFTGPYRQLAKVLGRKMIIFMNICGFAIDSCFSLQFVSG
jgi:hypothetical protein